MRLIDELASDAVFDTTPRTDKCRTFWEVLIQYYSHTEYIRTPGEIRSDSYILFGRVQCRAWMIIPLAVLSQFCLGSLYAWSIFNKPIDKHMYGDAEANRAQITFYIALGMLGASGAAFGPWIESHSPKMCALLGAALFFAGHCTAALGLFCKDIGMLYFGYGFIGGIGLGVGYVATIDAVIQWYPNARGFASGLAVSGFGSGSMAFSNINTQLIKRFSIPTVFIILGIINLTVMVLCALVMRPPPPNYNLPGVAADMANQSMTDVRCKRHSVQQTIKGKTATVGGQTVTVGSSSGDPVLVIPLADALSSADFWCLWAAFFVNLVFGVVIISNMASMTSNMFHGRTEMPVASLVTIEGAFNAFGRLFFGWASDWFGRRRTFLFIITLQISIVACLIVIMPRLAFWPFVVLVWLATLCYGGGVGVIPATLADMFGATNMSACHGVILTGWSVAAIGGGLTYTGIVNMLTHSAGYTLEDPRVYVINLYWILSLLLAGWLILLCVRVSPRQRLFPRVHQQIFCHFAAGYLIRLAGNPFQRGLHDYEFLSAALPAMDTELPTVFAQDGMSVMEKPAEAFDYVESAAKLSVSSPARGSCVQLVCSTPPRRRCLVVGKWRLEIVSREEVATVWRMYLSCALLASASDNE